MKRETSTEGPGACGHRVGGIRAVAGGVPHGSFPSGGVRSGRGLGGLVRPLGVSSNLALAYSVSARWLVFVPVFPCGVIPSFLVVSYANSTLMLGPFFVAVPSVYLLCQRTCVHLSFSFSFGFFACLFLLFSRFWFCVKDDALPSRRSLRSRLV